MQYYHHNYAMSSTYICNIITISMQYAWPLFVSMRLPLGLWQRGSLAINTAMNTSYHIQEKKQNTSYILSEDLLVVVVVYCVHVKWLYIVYM